MRIVGTAGHVDHGKSTLVTALTGVNPDRLKEEITREMTIDLGFASMTLPDGETIGMIDVPGHLHFIGNMLSGIGGIDAVLLVIAADEGVSEQTREHLSILDLLDIDRGLVVLTKIDLVENKEWLELVQMDVSDLLRGTSLEFAPIIPVSAKTGEGLVNLITQLSQVLKDTPQKIDLGRPRLPIDRVFTLTGFGTVVTGTLIDGGFSVGDEVIVQPGNLAGRIRGLQNHKHKLQHIHPGYRAALNITGVDKQQIKRGDVITLPQQFKPSQLLDAHFRLLSGSSVEFRHNLAVNIFIGAAEIPAHVRLLGLDKLEPGGEAYLQLKLESPTIATRGDRFILRLPSPSETIGGGVILDSQSGKLYRRFDTKATSHLQQLLSGKESDLVVEALRSTVIADVSKLAKRTNLQFYQVSEILNEERIAGTVIELTNLPMEKQQLFTTAAQWQQMTSALIGFLRDFHHSYPLKIGTTREQLRTAGNLTATTFDLILEKMNFENQIVLSGKFVSLSSHQVTLSSAQAKQAEPLLQQFLSKPFSPPDRPEAIQVTGEEVLEGLINSGQLIAVSDQILFLPQTIQQMTAWVKETIKATGSLSLGDFRDSFGTSRKYAAAFLEYLDSSGITVRKNDIRVLKQVQ